MLYAFVEASSANSFIKKLEIFSKGEDSNSSYS